MRALCPLEEDMQGNRGRSMRALQKSSPEVLQQHRAPTRKARWQVSLSTTPTTVHSSLSLLGLVALQLTSPLSVENGKAGTSSEPRPKRKASNAKSKLNEAGDEEDDDEDDEEEDGDEKTAPARKKRRAGSDRRSRLLKDVGELEGTIKKFQATFAKDLTKLQQTAASLAAQIRDMDS